MEGGDSWRAHARPRTGIHIFCTFSENLRKSMAGVFLLSFVKSVKEWHPSERTILNSVSSGRVDGSGTDSDRTPVSGLKWPVTVQAPALGKEAFGARRTSLQSNPGGVSTASRKFPHKQIISSSPSAGHRSQCNKVFATASHLSG